MKNHISFILFTLLFISCVLENDHTEREAVREYLRRKNVTDYTELEWGRPDSVFSPFTQQVSFKLFESKTMLTIEKLELRISEFEFNRNKYSDSIKIFHDSIFSLRNELRKKTIELLSENSKMKNNRKGITLKLLYKNTLGNERQAKYTFVFDTNGTTIGHHLDLFGHVCE